VVINKAAGCADALRITGIIAFLSLIAVLSDDLLILVTVSESSLMSSV